MKFIFISCKPALKNEKDCKWLNWSLDWITARSMLFKTAIRFKIPFNKNCHIKTSHLIYIVIVSRWWRVLQTKFLMTVLMTKFCWSIKMILIVKDITLLANIWNSNHSWTHEFIHFHLFLTCDNNMYATGKSFKEF